MFTASDKTYVDGVETPGLSFPHVAVYTASLETSDPVLFDKLFKRFLSESVLACIDEKGGVTMDRNGVTVRIYLKCDDSVKNPKKSVFFQG